MGRAFRVVVALAFCVFAVGCGAHKKTVSTTELVQSRLSVSLSSGSGIHIREGTTELLEPPYRPLTRAAAAREVRAYMRRHYGAVVDARCAREGQFMACWFRRGAGCARLEVQGAYNGATPVVISSVLPASRSSCA
jgi:hypothetical protein